MSSADLTLSSTKIAELTIAELVTLADQMAALAQSQQIIDLYKAWLTHHGADGFVHLAYYNLGVALTNSGDLEGAREALSAAIRLYPDFFAAYINLGGVLERLVSPEAAASCWQELVNRMAVVSAENIDYKNSAFKQMGRVLELEQAETALRQALEFNPHQHDVVEHWLSWRQQQCKWPVVEPFAQCDKAHLMKGFAPLSLATYTDDPLLQLANARMYNKTEIGQPKITFFETHQALLATPVGRIRVAYLCSDLRLHAVGFLMAEIFELHDREKVEVFIYNTGRPVGDHIAQRIQAAAEHWCDLFALSDEEAAKQIIADRIEIIIDVNGYTQTARLKLLAMRPAPIIVNWLGFPGTIGSPYHNYLIADGVLVPEGHEIFYSEKVLRLPCYQPNNRQRFVADRQPSRQEAGLPEGVMVYSCFNAVRKITAFTWEMWCRILHRVPESVLWLLKENEQATARLLAMAKAHGIAQERIIFAEMQQNHDHLARYPLVDLVLDTSPYGAHTTASDALWMGVPILTLEGLSFPARVCSSLVRAAGLPELVCTTAEDYEERAVALGLDRVPLMRYRQHLLAHRDHSVLFDTPSLVFHLEGLLAQMQADFRQGRLPRPDLVNLEIYQEIGIELDSDGVWFGTLESLHKAYREKLIEQDRLSLLPVDRRLWSDKPEDSVPNKPDLLATLLRLDGAGDLQGYLQCIHDNAHDFIGLRLALDGLLAEMRVSGGYIVAMLLANGGHQDVMTSFALCVGGALHDNYGETARGLALLSTQFDALSVEQQQRMIHRVIGPVLQGLHSKGVDLAKLSPLMALMTLWDARLIS